MTEDDWRAKEYQDSRPKGWGCKTVLLAAGAVLVAMVRVVGRIVR